MHKAAARQPYLPATPLFKDWGMEKEIVFKNVEKRYGEGEYALENVSFSVDTGEFVFVIGKSGAGKSTLLKMLSRQLRPTSGQIWVKGTEVTSLADWQVPFLRRQIGLMQAEYGLLPDRNVYENVELAMRATQQPKKLYKKRIAQTLRTMGVLHRALAFPDEISAGEAARVLLARALVVNPGILIADEPTANLDSDRAYDLMCLLGELNRLGVTVIIGSHDRELVSIMKKRVLTLSAGRLIADEKKAVYNYRAFDVIEERRIRNEQQQRLRTPVHPGASGSSSQQ